MLFGEKMLIDAIDINKSKSKAKAKADDKLLWVR